MLARKAKLRQYVRNVRYFGQLVSNDRTLHYCVQCKRIMRSADLTKQLTREQHRQRAAAARRCFKYTIEHLGSNSVARFNPCGAPRCYACCHMQSII